MMHGNYRQTGVLQPEVGFFEPHKDLMFQ